MARYWNLPLKAGTNAIISITQAWERFRKDDFFSPPFFKHSWEALQKSLGLDTHRRGAGCSLQPQELCQSHVLAWRWGRAGHPRLCVLGLRSLSGARRDLGAKEMEDPSWRESGHPPGSACSQPGEQRRRLKQSLSGEIRTLCKVIRFFLNAVW